MVSAECDGRRVSALCLSHTELLSPKAELLGFWRGKYWGWQRVPGQGRHLCVAAVPVSSLLEKMQNGCASHCGFTTYKSR